jgi:putative hydrolase of the HAD superfamily
MRVRFFSIRSRYRYVFMDMDRTLWDFEQNSIEALHELFTEYRLDSVVADVSTFTSTYIKHNAYLWDNYCKGELTKEVLRYKRFDATLSELGVNNHQLAAKLGEEYLRILPLKTTLIPGAKELLDYLAPKYGLLILSNGFHEVQVDKLKRCGLNHYFDRVVTSELSGYHKPDPRAFGYAISTASIKKNQGIMVGDDLEVDIIGALKFGMDQIYFNPERKLHSEKVTHEVETLGEITQIL